MERGVGYLAELENLLETLSTALLGSLLALLSHREAFTNAWPAGVPSSSTATSGCLFDGYVPTRDALRCMFCIVSAPYSYVALDGHHINLSCRLVDGKYVDVMNRV